MSTLEYLVSGIVGRHVTVRVEPKQATRAWSDGSTIFSDGRADRDVRAAVLVQAALMRCGSLDRMIALRLVGRTRLARRYLSVEAQRALWSLSASLPRALLAHPALDGTQTPSQSPADSLRIASGRGAIADPHPIFGSIRPVAVLRSSDIAPAATGDAGSAGERNDVEAESDPAADSRQHPPSSSPFGNSAMSELLAKVLGTQKPRGGSTSGESGDGSAKASGPTARKAGVGVKASPADMVRALGNPAHGSGSTFHRYQEWDHYHESYRAEWTRVEDLAYWDCERQIDIRSAIVPPTREMRRQLARLGLGFDRHRRQPSGDEIVTDDMVRFIVESRAGQAADARIYRALLKTRRDLGVLILLDTSTSAGDLSSDGRTIQQQQIALAWQIAATLDTTGDRIALYGFNSCGRERVRMLRVKSFDDRMGTATTDRLSCLVPAGFTRIGAAVRHAGHVIATQSGMPYRLVILITDGFSYDDGYEATYAEADTRRSLDELRADRTACLCLSVGSDAEDEKLRRVFGTSAFLRANRPELLPQQLGRMVCQTLATLC